MGRPFKYKTNEELQKAIDEYFKSCEGCILTDADGTPMLDKYGRPIREGERAPTITGLALALGFAGRQALMNYQGRAQFKDTILRAKSRCEAYAEERLFDKDGTHGAQFSLRCNFGWNDKADESSEQALQKLDDIMKKIGGVI